MSREQFYNGNDHNHDLKNEDFENFDNDVEFEIDDDSYDEIKARLEKRRQMKEAEKIGSAGTQKVSNNARSVRRVSSENTDIETSRSSRITGNAGTSEPVKSTGTSRTSASARANSTNGTTAGRKPIEKSRTTKSEKKSKKFSIGAIAAKVALCVITFVLILVLTLLAAIGFICKGPSVIVRDMFVMAMTETGQMDFLAYIFLSDKEVSEILASHEIIVPEGETDTSLIQVGDKNEGENSGEAESDFDINGLEIIDIKGKTFKGKLMVVNDPSRITVGTAAAYGDDCVGYTTLYMAESTNSIAAINGGGYVDKASNKTGGLPAGRNEDGIVIAGGQLKYGNLNTTYEIIGIDNNGILHVDYMTAQQALDKGIRDAVNWGPILVKNGEPCVVPTDSANVGFHPRSAIGQRADGAILLLVIDGRQANSIGASYDDLIEIMVENGAVNAANLDGGMSSYMVYENEIITEPYLLYAPRNVATSWLVSRVKGE